MTNSSPNPNFLALPSRDAKPRARGLTCVIDPGLGVGEFADLIQSAGCYIDLVKFGWGTGIITRGLNEKIRVLKENDIGFWFGGTLFEIAYAQNRLDELVNWVKAHGARYFEISDGTIVLDLKEKSLLIRRLSERFDVLAEVGSKDVKVVMSPKQWIKHINEALNAGAWRVIAEGRESGISGIFRETGEVRMGLIQELQEAGLDLNRMLFEAPQKAQQVWFLRNTGLDVNLSNILPRDVINLESLRLRLRSDTMTYTNRQ